MLLGFCWALNIGVWGLFTVLLHIKFSQWMIARAFLCRTEVASIVNQPVGDPEPFFFGEERHEVPLYFLRRFLFSQAEALGETHDMGIHGNAFYDTVGVPQDDIRALPRDAGKRQDFFHRLRHFPAKLFFHLLRGREDILCSVSIKARRANVRGGSGEVGARIVIKRPVLLKKYLGNFVHLLVGALRREHDRDEKFPVISVCERDFRAGKKFFERREKFSSALSLRIVFRHAAYRSMETPAQQKAALSERRRFEKKQEVREFPVVLKLPVDALRVVVAGFQPRGAEVIGEHGISM